MIWRYSMYGLKPVPFKPTHYVHGGKKLKRDAEYGVYFLYQK